MAEETPEEKRSRAARESADRARRTREDNAEKRRKLLEEEGK